MIVMKRVNEKVYAEDQQEFSIALFPKKLLGSAFAESRDLFKERTR